MAYMLGIPDTWLGEYYSQRYPAFLEKLCMDKDVTIIRYLSKIRTGIMNNFLNVDKNFRADKYMWHITRLIDEHIDVCKVFS